MQVDSLWQDLMAVDKRSFFKTKDEGSAAQAGQQEWEDELSPVAVAFDESVSESAADCLIYTQAQIGEEEGCFAS